MKSNEVFQDVFKKHGAKKIASEMGLSPSFLYKWCQSDGGRASGALNALERLAKLTEVTGDLRPLQWLCGRAGGYFVSNPKVKGSARAEFLSETGSVMQEMAHLQAAVAEALLDGRVTKKEAVEVRNLWERLKSDMERYSTECDKGEFRRGNFDTSPLIPLPVRGGEDARV